MPTTLMVLQGEELESCMTEILNKKINRERASKLCQETSQKLLDRKWLMDREEIKSKLAACQTTEEKLALIKTFDASNRPTL